MKGKHMKKIITAGIITMVLSGCASFIPRQDIYEKVEFKDEKIVKGKNTIDIYRVEYPSDYYEKLQFFKEFELASKKMLLENKSLNLLTSRDLYEALNKFKKGEYLAEEELYRKTAADLDTFQRAQIDEAIKVSVTDRGGPIQAYLNKQVYFWMSVTGKKSDFDGSRIYTELDKQRLMEEVKGERKELFQVLNAMRLSLVIEVDDPYAAHSKGSGYWASKEINLFNPTDISRELQSIEEPLYLNNVKEEDVKILGDTRGDFDTPILILESDRLEGYTIRDGKYIMYHGGDTIRGYYKDYDLRIRIVDEKLENLVLIEEGILLKDILDRTQVKAKGVEETQKKEAEKSLDWGLN